MGEVVGGSYIDSVCVEEKGNLLLHVFNLLQQRNCDCNDVSGRVTVCAPPVSAKGAQSSPLWYGAGP